MSKKTIIFLILFILIFSFINNKHLREPDYLPAIIFVYDDGYKEDVTKALPIHQKYNVPAVSAVNSSTIGNVNTLDIEDLLRLQANGWEIASHGKYHSALIYNSLTENANIGDKKIELNNSNLVEERYTYYIYNTEKRYGEKIKFSYKVNKDNEKYHILSSKLNNYYPKESSIIMLTENSMKEEIVASKHELENMGLDINNFVYPYNGIIEPARNIVKNHYNFGRGGPHLNQKFPDRFINYLPLSVHRLKGISFEENLLRKEALDLLLTKAADKKALLIFYAHTGNGNFDSKRLEYIIKTAQKLNYNITTFKELSGK
ncbi:MAG: polysaccharide deacetylase family protein [Halanaerobiales bacterium]|nr:polysaccharide deacetylase family protein [Halanaerobiales bacterium]